MQKKILVSENPIVREASEGVVLRVLANLKNGGIEDALVGFAEEFRFKDQRACTRGRLDAHGLLTCDSLAVLAPIS